MEKQIVISQNPVVEDVQIELPYVRNTPNRNISEKKETLNVLSLFSGCGGMDLGFEGGFIAHKRSINPRTEPDYIEKKLSKNWIQLKKNKFNTVFANDILNEARKTWLNNFDRFGHGPSHFYSDSIVDLVKLHKAGNTVFPSDIDIVTGGFPCQDFSLAGKRKGFSSTKNHLGKRTDYEIPTIESRGMLYFWMKEVIEITKPKMFVAENVKGLVNLDNVLEIIQNDFQSVGDGGYIVLPAQVLHAADYGIAQSRERVIFIGLRKDCLLPDAKEKFTLYGQSSDLSPFPLPSHSPTGDGVLEPYLTLEEIFANLPEPEESTDPAQQVYSKAKYLGKKLQGQNEVKLKGIGPTIRAEHHGNIEFRRLSVENGGKNELNKGLPQRRLTPRECALIQSFPPDFVLVTPKTEKLTNVSSSEAYKVIGNAVPPILAYKIARRIQSIWNYLFF